MGTWRDDYSSVSQSVIRMLYSLVQQVPSKAPRWIVTLTAMTSKDLNIWGNVRREYQRILLALSDIAVTPYSAE